MSATASTDGRAGALARRAARFVAVAATLVLAGCPAAPSRNAKQAPPIEEVRAAPDAQASLAGDTVAAPVPRAGAVAGSLPADFPRDVPLPRPSSLVDFGPRSVTLEIEGSLEATRRSYEASLARAGYAVRADGSWRRGTRALRVTYGDHGGATRVEIEILGRS